jgi:K+-transporting ATPase KdpF subunit
VSALDVIGLAVAGLLVLYLLASLLFPERF